MGEIFPMKGGNGAYSYTKNSHIQRAWSDSMKEMIQDAVIRKLDAEISTTNTNTITIADFGCSVGPNTFFAVENLIQSVKNKFRDSKNNLVEFQVFFSDHTANDFNTLFASLPPDRQYHAAGVPGSFHARLFPRASITLAHSSYTLHWLSRVPKGVISSNKERIFYVGDEDDVVWKAYSEQFERDTGKFMSARAEEIVRGGLMFLIIPGICDGATHAHFHCVTAFNLLHSTLTDLAAEGVIDKGEMEGFNLPIYFPSLEEVKKVIEENGCFKIERFEVRKPRLKMSAGAIIDFLRAAVEAIFTQQFGDSVMEKVFSKTMFKAEEEEEASEMLEAELYDSAQLFYVLKRK